MLPLSLAREAAVAKKLSCRIGRHAWTTRVEQGESYKVCSVCGKPELPANSQILGMTGDPLSDRPTWHDHSAPDP